MAQILDYLGRPVTTNVLEQEQAGPDKAGVRPPIFDSIANTLTPAELAAILVSVDNNDIISYLTLAEEMEERDLHYHSVLGTRKSAVAGLPVTVEAVSDDPKEVEKRDFVFDVVTSDAFDGLLFDALDALGKGFSVCEILWDRSGPRWIPKEYKFRDPRFFQFDSATVSELRLRDVANLTDGLPLAPFKFIQHRPRIKTGLTIRGGLARLVVVAYMCKSYDLKDWMAFAEIFGMPIRVGKYPQAATPNQKAALLSAVANIGTDAACIIPDGMIIDFIEAQRGSGGEKLFEGLANWLDKQVSKGVLGQTMTTDDGSSLSQAQVHDEVRQDLVASDAKQLSATIRRDLVKPLIDLNFGTPVDGKYPKFSLTIEKPEDLKALSESLAPFIDRGLRVEASVIRDKFNLPEPEEGAELLAPQSSGLGQMFPPTQTPSPSDGPGEEPEEPEEVEPARQLKLATAKIMKAIAQGKTITEDQRQLVMMQLAKDTMEMARKGAGPDEIDKLTAEALGDWKKLMDPVLAPVLDLAKTATSYEEFLKGLKGALAKMDTTELAKRLAVANFKARGLGDAKDQP